MLEPKSFNLSPAIHDYLVRHGTPPDEVQRSLIAATEQLGENAIMQIPPEQGAFMTLLTRAIGARRAIEVGTFTGYSSLCIARGLSEDGMLVSCDVNEEWTAIAKKHWEAAGIAHKINLCIGPAAETLRALPIDPVWDLAFIDADKVGYRVYFEEIVRRLRPGGIMLVDNVLYFGRVVGPTTKDLNLIAIKAFNEKAAADPRVECVMLPVGDGLTLLRKK